MNILVVGSPEDHSAFQAKFTAEHNYEYVYDLSPGAGLHGFDAVFDFTVGDQPEQMEAYTAWNDLSVFVNAPKISLGELAYYQDEMECKLFGFNGLPTFLQRDILEVSCFDEADAPQLQEVCKALDTDYELVQDRVGMVTPRIIFMIINY